MKIEELLNPKLAILNLQANDKDSAIREMADMMADQGIVNNEEEFIKSIWDRENQTTTGIGDGIAMPHARNKNINKAAVLFAKSENGIDFKSLDGKPVHLFFMIAAPEGADNAHLQALAKLSSLLIDPEFVNELKKATSGEEVISLFKQKDAAITNEKNKKPKISSERPLIVGVTACINGIAHTYMAQEALIKAGEALGYNVHIETNGSEGVKNKLTAEDISKSEGVIIASDKKVEMARFDGKPLVSAPVVAGINKPQDLIKQIADHQASIYNAGGQTTKQADKAEISVGSTIYRNLMNGISHMLPFVIGGGILIALSFIVEQYAGGAKSPLFVFLNTIGGMAFTFMVPVLSAYIAESIGDLPALMPGFVGGYMASNVINNAKSPAGFLGGLVAGFMAGYITLALRKVCSKIPKSLEGMKPMLLYPVLGLLLIAAIMYYIVSPIFSGLNFAITNFLNHMGTGNLIILTSILGGMMAIDMGGPFNKAAYVFASGAFANNPHDSVNAILMAAVMVGGMVPPFATAIGTVLFKNKYTESERRAGISNWILGWSFITEGAIPFAAADPGRVIPSCVLGSAIAGFIVGLTKVGIPAPHGGFWVAPLATNIVWYFIAVIVGSLVSGVVLSLWKKAVK
ncbi:PTS fructose transporter subunit IIABC [Lactobacillus iners]|jgi:PTS system, fru family, IIC component|uniref:PTS fructose transporter subunit IIABC n=1 Tax=Lactobacillus iners TaxID=147802 RepID=UPI001F09E4AC|nr:fructose-specific PTS transporter subunit EIIC [Lactobacillus iners]MCT7845026.1 fructose-specific PTS transporter subunit EIIC [Lactobacillus iners]